jgi:hypothetical protein
MRFSLRAFALGGVALACAAQLFAQSSDYRGLITDGGEFKFLNNGQQVMILRFGLFFDGWQELRATAVGPQPDGSYTSTATLNPGTMTVNYSYSVSNGVARITIKATPNRNLTANSSHINIRFDEAFWADASFSAGNWSTTFPRRLDQTVTSSGRVANTFLVSSPAGLSTTLRLQGTYDYALRDSRQYNAGFELRAQQSSGGWTAGQTRTYVIDVQPNIAMPIGPNQPVTVAAGPDWVPLTNMLSISPGSALDWSKPSPEIAGSKGWLKVSPNGQYYFENEPNTPVRFFGTNVSGSAVFLDASIIDSMVDQFYRLCYNMVRLHHIDETLTWGTGTNSTTINPFYAQRLHYFVEACRQKGIYVAIDLYSQRIPRTNEILPGSVNFVEFKLLMIAHSGARQNWKDYALNLLNSTSPYTGRKMKDEPALALMTLVNEQAPLAWPRGTLRSEVFDSLEAASGRPWGVVTDQDAQSADQLLSACYQWMKTELRNNGVKALFSSVNVGEQNAVSRSRSQFDFQDAHLYYAHPEWLGTPWTVPFRQMPTPPLKNMQHFGRYAAARVHNKAYFVGEMDAVTPSPYRGEIGLFVGALAAVQNWDAILRFGYTDRIQYLQSLYPSMAFQTVTDPAAMASERALKALFHRGDLDPNESDAVINVPWNQAGINDNRNIPLVKNGALLRPFAMSHSQGATTIETPILDGVSRRADGTVEADLFRQSLKINTPNTCGIISNPGAELTAGRLKANVQGARASIWASSVDGLSLYSSRRVLLTHLTEIQNTGTTWTGAEREVVTSTGTLPHLARNGSATITLETKTPSTARVYRLDLSGRRVATVSVTKGKYWITFTATTQNPAGGATVYYEVVY